MLFDTEFDRWRARCCSWCHRSPGRSLQVPPPVDRPRINRPGRRPAARSARRSRRPAGRAGAADGGARHRPRRRLSAEEIRRAPEALRALTGQGRADRRLRATSATRRAGRQQPAGRSHRGRTGQVRTSARRPRGLRAATRRAGAGSGPEVGDVLPPFVRPRLRLDAEQGRKIKELESDIRAKLNRILDEQMRDSSGPSARGRGATEEGRPGGPGGPTMTTVRPHAPRTAGRARIASAGPASAGRQAPVMDRPRSWRDP